MKWLFGATILLLGLTVEGAIFLRHSHLRGGGERCPLVIEGATYDFGRVRWGESPYHVFRMVNTSRREVTIGALETTCLCTAARVSRARLGPGQSGAVRVQFHPPGFTGRVQQTVLVRLGGVPQPVGLHIRANIDPLLAVSPDSVDLGAIRPGALVAARVILHNTSGRPVQITAVEPSAPYVRARLTRAAQPQALEISLVNPPAGSLHERVTLRTSLGIRPRIDIPIQAQVRCKWALSDREFFFGFVNNGLRVSRTIEVSGLRRATVKRVWTTVTGASARVEPRLSRLGTTLAATLDLTRAQQGLLDGGVLVDTGDPQQPILNIPFVGVVSDPAENTTCCGQHSVQGPNASTARATPRSPSGETNAH